MFSNTAFKAVQFGGFTKKSIIYSLRRRCKMKTVQQYNYSICWRDTPTLKEGNNAHATASTEWNAFVSLPPWRRKTQRFVGNPAGLPGYTIVRTNNVLLEATKPEQTDQSGGGGVVGSWKQSHQESPPYSFYVNFPTQILMLAGWLKGLLQRQCSELCRTLEPAARAGGSAVQPRGTGRDDAGAVGDVTNALTTSSCVLCQEHHVPLCSFCVACAPFPPQPLWRLMPTIKHTSAHVAEAGCSKHI